MCEAYLIFAHRADILSIVEHENIDNHFSIQINFLELFEYNANLGSALLDNPEESLSDWEKAAYRVQVNLLQEHGSKLKLKSNIHCRIYNMPPWPHVSRIVFPSNEDSEKFLQVSGTVIRISAPKLLEYEREYICVKCKYPITVRAIFDKRNVIKQPKTCSNPEGCNGKNIITFDGINRDTCRDYQEIKIQEDLSKTGTGSVPNTMCVALEDDLVNVCKPGENVTICGIVKRTWSDFIKGQKIDVNLVLKANHVQVNSKSNIVVSPEDRFEYENFWKKYVPEPLLGRTLILKSMCPEIYGLNLVKLAIAVVLAGASQNDTFSSTGISTRAESHLLLVGDPGTGKSQMLRFASKLIPRSVLTTGVGSSAAGLTVTALMEKGEWKLEAGALVMSDGGICCIDEFNSMKEHDRTTIYEAMEQQTISVAKAGIVCKLRTRCSILAACNPKGNLDPTEPLCMNIAMASPLLSRFDLVLLIRDTVNQEWDTKLTDYILNMGLNSNRDDTPWSLQKLQSYFMIIKSINPKLTEEATSILSKYYQLQRSSASRNKSRTTVRLLESLIRLSQGHARLMFHNDVEIVDAIFAVILADTSMDYESSLLNINVNSCTFFDDPVDFYFDALKALLPKLELEDMLETQLQKFISLHDSVNKSNSNSILTSENNENNSVGNNAVTGHVLRNNSFDILNNIDVQHNSMKNLGNPFLKSTENTGHTKTTFGKDFNKNLECIKNIPSTSRITKSAPSTSTSNNYYKPTSKNCDTTMQSQPKIFDSTFHNFRDIDLCKSKDQFCYKTTSDNLNKNIKFVKDRPSTSKCDRSQLMIPSNNLEKTKLSNIFSSTHLNDIDFDEDIFSDSNHRPFEEINARKVDAFFIQNQALISKINVINNFKFTNSKPSTYVGISFTNNLERDCEETSSPQKNDLTAQPQASIFSTTNHKLSDIDTDGDIFNKRTFQLLNKNAKLSLYQLPLETSVRPKLSMDDNVRNIKEKSLKEQKEENTVNQKTTANRFMEKFKLVKSKKRGSSSSKKEHCNVQNVIVPLSMKDNNVQTREVSSISENIAKKRKGEINEAEMLKALPSINDDFLNFDLDFKQHENNSTLNKTDTQVDCVKANTVQGSSKNASKRKEVDKDLTVINSVSGKQMKNMDFEDDDLFSFKLDDETSSYLKKCYLSQKSQK